MGRTPVAIGKMENFAESLLEIEMAVNSPYSYS